ncbi:phosphatidylglycerophosphatase A family protein [Thiolapillus sp.]
MKKLPPPDLKNPVHFLAFGFGSGCAPVAPGTWGTLVAVLLYLPLSLLPLLPYVLVTAAVAVVGIWLCGRTAADLQEHDHPGIVWDEFAGFFVTMIAAPSGWQWIVAGFLLFRLFDIWKPWPIRVLDRRVSGGFGIMVDDLLAGVYALILLQLAYRFLA